jgi:hypothetical protein
MLKQRRRTEPRKGRNSRSHQGWRRSLLPSRAITRQRGAGSPPGNHHGISQEEDRLSLTPLIRRRCRGAAVPVRLVAFLPACRPILLDCLRGKDMIQPFPRIKSALTIYDQASLN